MKKSNTFKLFLMLTVMLLSAFTLTAAYAPMPTVGVFGDVLYCTEDADNEEIKLIPGGYQFGVKFYTKGVVVVGLSDVETAEGFDSPARNAGFEKGDIITEAQGIQINGIDEVARAIEQCGGGAVTFTVKRSSEILKLTLSPVTSLSDGKYKSGMWIRDSTAGIGTVTYIHPETLAFGGLGHGICDSDTGTLMPLQRGVVVDVEVSDIVRGIGGKPGEIKGIFGTKKTGTLTSNSHLGVFGTLDAPPPSTLQPLPIATRTQVKQGKAQIYCRLAGEDAAYDIEISSIDRHSTDSKSFVVKVTDSRLAELTGGIIQGMSGSPIVQNGRLVGAVTHVFVNDPTKGYGIFIENMLSEAQKAE